MKPDDTVIRRSAYSRREPYAVRPWRILRVTASGRLRLAQDVLEHADDWRLAAPAEIAACCASSIPTS